MSCTTTRRRSLNTSKPSVFPHRNKTKAEAKRYIECGINLMSCHWQLGQFAEAEDWAERVLRHAEKHFDRKHVTLAWARRRVSSLLATQGDPARAKSLLAAALEILDVPDCPDRAELGFALSALSGIRSAEGEKDEAERLDRRATAELEKRYGPDSAKISDTLRDAASRLMARGKFAEAILLAQRAYKNCPRRSRQGQPQHG